MQHAGLNKHLEASFPVVTKSEETKYINSSLLKRRDPWCRVITEPVAVFTDNHVLTNNISFQESINGLMVDACWLSA